MRPSSKSSRPEAKLRDLGSRSLRFKGSGFRSLRFRGSGFRKLRFRGSGFRNLRFRGSRFRSLRFRGSRFRNLGFRGFGGLGFRVICLHFLNLISNMWNNAFFWLALWVLQGPK